MSVGYASDKMGYPCYHP